ncbi:MAG: signal recognition particle subunit SRP19/SEC65 family protein [Nitrososphaerota archaeon]|nr:signal recognition particle protein Srp19 [Aigarchaeota archaeon]MDW8076900.1 signal recognition particle subunit SRP19/SEC65 family protein [Nitrososphaerota archaeon]
MIRREGFIIWPTYFDRSLSWREGRRVPLRLSSRSPTVEKLSKAAQKLGWYVKVEVAAHPKTHWKKTGRLVVKPDKLLSKQSVIKALAQELLKQEMKER